MTFLNHVRFTKRLQYIIALVFSLTFSHKYKMEFWKDNCGSHLKLLLVWDPHTSKIHIEVWKILFQCVWIIIICTEFWKEKWKSLSIPLIWHLKLLLVWDPHTSKIHIEVWKILFHCVWIIIICTEFWKEKWESLSIPLIWHLDVSRLNTKVWRINFQVFLYLGLLWWRRCLGIR